MESALPSAGAGADVGGGKKELPRDAGSTTEIASAICRQGIKKIKIRGLEPAV